MSKDVIALLLCFERFRRHIQNYILHGLEIKTTDLNCQTKLNGKRQMLTCMIQDLCDLVGQRFEKVFPPASKHGTIVNGKVHPTQVRIIKRKYYPKKNILIYFYHEQHEHPLSHIESNFIKKVGQNA